MTKKNNLTKKHLLKLKALFEVNQNVQPCPICGTPCYEIHIIKKGYNKYVKKLFKDLALPDM